MSEWLEEIKSRYLVGIHTTFGTPWVSMPKENADWLIQQAEKVERYEKVLKQIARHELFTESYFCDLEANELIYKARKALEGEKHD